MRRIVIATAVLVSIFSGRSEACSYPEPPTFQEALSSATSVFVFRLDEARYKRISHGPAAHSAWVEGKIRLVQNLYGNPIDLRIIKYSTFWCGGVDLVVGHHYLIATNASGDTIQLAASDASLYDIEGFYYPHNKAWSLRSLFVFPVIQSIYGIKPLPKDFPPRDIAARTVIQAPPPPSEE